MDEKISLHGFFQSKTKCLPPIHPEGAGNQANDQIVIVEQRVRRLNCGNQKFFEPTGWTGALYGPGEWN